MGGELALYLERNYTESKSLCQSRLRKLKEQRLDPLIKNLTPATDFKTIEEAFVRIISEYDSTCVGPASDEVLNNFIEVSAQVHNSYRLHILEMFLSYSPYGFDWG